MSKYKHIPEQSRAGFAARNIRSIAFPIMHMDMCDGNASAALILSQIYYWHDGRLQVFRDEYWWLAKNHADWYKECRIKPKTAARALERLQALGLIVYELHGFNGQVTPHIRINWDVYDQKEAEWIAAEIGDEPRQNVQTPLTKCPDPLDKVSDSNTETTQRLQQPLSASGDTEADSPAAGYEEFDPYSQIDLENLMPVNPRGTSSESPAERGLAVYLSGKLKHPLTKNQVKKITNKVTASADGRGVSTYPSPADEYDDSPDLFEQYVDEIIEWYTGAYVTPASAKERTIVIGMVAKYFRNGDDTENKSSAPKGWIPWLKDHEAQIAAIETVQGSKSDYIKVTDGWANTTTSTLISQAEYEQLKD